MDKLYLLASIKDTGETQQNKVFYLTLLLFITTVLRSIESVLLWMSYLKRQCLLENIHQKFIFSHLCHLTLSAKIGIFICLWTNGQMTLNLTCP